MCSDAADDGSIHLTIRGSPASPDAKASLDRNGCPTERVWLGGQEVVVHYDDVSETDITMVDGVIDEFCP